MPPTPHVQPLSKRHRTVIFLLSLFLFLVLVPLLVLYAIGYRIDLASESQNFRAVGGMYVSTDTDQAEIYVDEAEVEDMRLFQQAAYVQNLNAGLHQIHTQGVGIQTWVKELPVFAHLVTQARSFNMPATTTVRYVAPYVTDAGEPVYQATATSARPFQHATTVQDVLFATSSLTTLGEVNPEHTFLVQLLASTTEDRAVLAEKEAYTPPAFSFEPPKVFPTTTASTTRLEGDMALTMQDDELYARWEGSMNDIPYYFCVFTDSYATTSALYGEHVAEQLFLDSASTTALASTTVAQNGQLCRSEIRIDRKWQSVIWFEFMPDNPNLVLLQLQDGIYVVEVDDRAWQNVQQLYAGDYLTMVVDGGQIFVQDGDIIFEVLTEAPLN